MSFLAPLFLLGAAAISLPIVFHLIRRSSRERVPFSSLMFLLPTPPRVTRRSKLENLLLLLLRCAVVFLLAFAFARPYFSQPVLPDPGANAGEKILVLLDTSASMRRAGLWDQATAKAQATFSEGSASRRVACFAFDRELRPMFSFEDWSGIPPGERSAWASKRLAGTKPGWGATRLGNALLMACEMFDSKGKDEQMIQRIVLISDLQEGSRLDGLQGFEWPRGLQIQVEAVKPATSSNAGLQLAPERETGPSTSTNVGPRLRVSNASDSKREQFQIGWRRPGQDAPFGGTLDVYVPPGQSRILSAPPAPADLSADGLILTGDDERFDNAVFIVPPKVNRAKLLYLGEERETDTAAPLFYLKRAFQETRTLAVEVQPRSPGTVLPEKDLAESSLIIVGASLPAEQCAAVRRFAEQGKGVLIVINDASMGPTLENVAGLGKVTVAEGHDRTYSMLAQIDFGHPLFAPFADPRYSDFTKIHFWKHRAIELEPSAGAHVLARFDGGDLALAEIPRDKGRIWVLASGWRPEDSQLALSSKFVPLLYAMLEQSGVGREQRWQYAVGDAVTIAAGSTNVTIRRPDASEVQLAVGEPFAGTDQPGIYTATSAQSSMAFAVNLAPEESRTAPLPLEELERLGLPLQQPPQTSPREAQRRKEHLQAVQLENRQKLWRWLIVGALVVLMLETWLAGRATRRPLSVLAETPS
jgi:hypothetical protein